MHPLLERQLQELGLSEGVPALDARRWDLLIKRISGAYADADQERYLLERSLTTASAEMQELHESLKTSSDQRYRELFENANDIIYTVTFDAKFTSINRVAELLTGYSRDELIGEHVSKYAQRG